MLLSFIDNLTNTKMLHFFLTKLDFYIIQPYYLTC